jgi:hypothetical protein
MRIWCICVILAIVIIMCILGFSKSSDLAHYIPASILNNDKALHCGFFSALTAAIYFLWDRNLRHNVILTYGCMMALSFGSEVVQGLSPYRRFDVRISNVRFMI